MLTHSESLDAAKDPAHVAEAEPVGSVFARLLSGDTPAITPERAAELEASAAAEVRRMLHDSRAADVRDFFGPVVLDTDWTHADLAHNRENIERVKAWQYGPKGILAAGRCTGTGKSRAVAALTMRIYADEGKQTAMWHAQELFARITQSNDFGRDFAREFIDGLASVKLLVIEDLGQEATARAQQSVIQQWFFRLLDLRAGAGLPCLITTNHTAETLSASTAQKISADPLIRRLLAVCDPVRFNPIPSPTK